MTFSVTYLGLADAAKPTGADAAMQSATKLIIHSNSYYNDMLAMDENTLHIKQA